VAAAPARLAAALPRFGKRAERDALQYRVERIAGQIDAWVQDCVRIADLREVVLLGHEVRASLEASMPQQMVLLEEVARRMRKQGASADRLYILMRQHVLLERILRSARAVLQAGVEGVTAQDRLHRDTAVYVRTLDALIDGNADLGVQALADADSLADLRAARERFGPVADQLGVLANDQDIMGAGDSLQELAFARDSLIDDLRALATKVQGEPL
jgi:twitching motility protein PilJ